MATALEGKRAGTTRKHTNVTALPYGHRVGKERSESRDRKKESRKTKRRE